MDGGGAMGFEEMPGRLAHWNLIDQIEISWKAL
jgi:hypothetical protein